MSSRNILLQDRAVLLAKLMSQEAASPAEVA